MNTTNSTQSSLEDFDGQVITDYFDSLVMCKKIKGFSLVKNCNTRKLITCTWELLLRKRWKYVCTIVISQHSKEYFEPQISSTSRECTLSIHTNDKGNVLGLLKIIIGQLLAGINAEKRVISIVNNELVLSGKASVHCFPTSNADDIKGVDIYLYFRLTPSSDVVKIPVQIKHAVSGSEIALQHKTMFPGIPIVFTKYTNDEEIMLQIVTIINNYLKTINPS